MTSERIPELPGDLKSFAAELASLTPAGGELRRDELMYRAGWEACAVSSERATSQIATSAHAGSQAHGKSVRDRRSAWLWPLSTVGLLLVSAILGIALATRTPEVQVVYVPNPAGSSLEAKQSQGVKPAGDSQHSTSEGVAVPQVPLLSQTPNFRRPPLRRGDDYLALRQRVLAYGVDVLRTADICTPPGENRTATDSRYGVLIGELRGG